LRFLLWNPNCKFYFRKIKGKIIMKTVDELRRLKELVIRRKQGGITPAVDVQDMLTVIDQAIADRQTINRWYGFLSLMAKRSSWGDKINEVLDEYRFGTADANVREAARRYMELTRLHDGSR
jgi:hypothetical protein